MAPDALTGATAARFDAAGERFRAGDLDGAAGLLEEVLAEAPSFARGWFLLGFVEGNRRRFDAAVTKLERAVALAPDDAEPRLFLARAYAQLRRTGDARASYREAIRLAPRDAAAHLELGGLLLGTGSEEDALVHLRRAAELNPGATAPLLHLGIALMTVHRPAEAAGVLRRAHELDPADPAVVLQLGQALRDANQRDEAIRVLREGAARAPQSAALRTALGNVLAVAGRGPEAIAALEEALALDPADSEALGWLFREKLHACDWEGLDALRDRLRAGIDTGGPVLHPLVWCAFSTSSAELRRVADRWAAHEIARAAGARCPARRLEQRRWIRLGYVSSDFRDHAVAQLLAEVIELHDRAAFQVFAYSTGTERAGDMRRRLEGAFDDVIDIAGEADAAAAARIRADEIDILVDLNGYTRGSRPGVFARRPAPVLVSYLGYPGTLGTGLADYIIGDATVTPLAQAAHYAEKIVQLPHCFQPNDRQRAIGATKPRAEYGLPAADLVLCCFNQAHKISPQILDVWCEALAAAPGAVLWLAALRGDALANLRAQIRRRGVDERRLVVAGYLPRHEDHLARVRCADLFVDTFPYGAHTTGSDALWAGVPVVTLAGETFASRVAASLLGAVGLGELVARTLDEYRALVLELVARPERLRGLRARLAAGGRDAPLFDSTAYTRVLERAYRAMWDRSLAGAPPDHIIVPG